MKNLLYLALPLLAAVLLLALFARYAAVETASSIRPGGATLILDAGHGGTDGGAVAPDGTEESTLNLAVVLRMRELLGLYGVVPVLTRAEEELAYPPSETTVRGQKVWDQKTRLALIGNTQSPVLLSIHQNQYPGTGPHGAQALWAPTEGSQALAVWLQTLLVTELRDGNRRTAAQISEEIYLMNALTCPAVLVECGFLSNPGELARLQTEAYRLRLAAILTAGYLTWAETARFYGGAHESEDSFLLY